jgi:hypothetical protein
MRHYYFFIEQNVTSNPNILPTADLGWQRIFQRDKIFPAFIMDIERAVK